MNDTRTSDKYLWLEEIDSQTVMEWVTPRSEATHSALGTSERAHTAYQRALDILDANDRIPWPVLRGEFAYTLWRDAEHPRGLWRRISWSALSEGAPGPQDPRWELLLDVDALAEEEGINWVYSGTVVHRSQAGDPDRRALVRFSRGGADAVEVREYDLLSRRFIPPAEGGFFLDECKSQLSFFDENTLVLSAPLDPLESDGTPGADATDSGYARLVRLWKRGTAPADAPIVLEGSRSDVAVAAGRDSMSGRLLATRAVDFYESETWFWPEAPLDHRGLPPAAPVQVPIPLDCRLDSHDAWLLLRPRTELVIADRHYPGGSVLAVPWSRLEADPSQLPEPTVLFTPTPRSTVEDVTWGCHRLLLTIMEDTESRIAAHAIPADPGPKAAPTPWPQLDISSLGEHLTIDVLSCDPLSPGTDVKDHTGRYPDPDDAICAVSGPIVPPTMVLLRADGSTTVLASTPARFDPTGIEVSRHHAISDDGTRIPYTVMRGPHPNGPGPTILYGYGGFEVSMRPSYAALRGALWLEQGGTYVVAGIRGGGEYGPDWHTAAVREHRPRAYEDFAAVARELVATGVAAPGKLGATGGSNGGLLMGVMLTRYPELFSALAIAVPLLDMRRYHLLLAGASWMAEYGNPDSPDWEDFLAAYSPYQNIVPAAERRYPPVLMMTSTRDDRVHPGHARKMTAALEAGGQPVTYFENTEGGHAGAADNSQEARKAMLTYEFFWQQLEDE